MKSRAETLKKKFEKEEEVKRERLAAAEESDRLQQESAEQKSKEKQEQALRDYANAAIAYTKYDVGLLITDNPKYFRIDKHTKTEPETKMITHFVKMVEISPSPNALKTHFVELMSPESQNYFRRMLEGGSIASPEKDEDGNTIFDTFDRKVYSLLTSTNQITDTETYNLLSLDGVMKPSGAKVTECPLPLQALLTSMSGSKRTWEQDHWELTKKENYDWLEKWIYGVVCGSIGNNFLSAPVFFGGGKTGRNALADRVITGILGENLVVTVKAKSIGQDFNSIQVAKVFMFLNEIPIREDIESLKADLGAPVIVINEKYKAEIKMDNTICYMIASNAETYPLPMEDGEQMVRFSPIKVDKTATFSEMIVEYLTKPKIEADLHSINLVTDHLSKYQLGDTWLKRFGDKWFGKEVLQEFLDYLHTKYGGTTYELQPLRGKDWLEIKTHSKKSTDKLLTYILRENPEWITEDVVYRIYTVFQTNRSTKPYQQKVDTVVSLIKTDMLHAGYVYHDDVLAEIPGGGGDVTACGLFSRIGPVPVAKNDYDRYITEEPGSRRLVLKYTKKPGGPSNVTPIKKFQI